jgi:aldehyde dehydrogenase (NAD+)
VPADLCQVILGGRDVGQALVDHPGIPLVSATGSTTMGRTVAPRVAARFGRSILELGGNNAAIVTPSADLNLAVPGIVSSATGTAGQRCTSLRRLIVHRSILDDLVSHLVTVYKSLSVGDPLQLGTLIGPLIDRGAYDAMVNALTAARTERGDVVVGGDRVDNERPDGFYVRPSIVVMPSQTPVVGAETLAPILYVIPYDTFDEAIAIHNGVAQGLASSIYTTDIREAERFMSSAGSDCGIANVNLGPSRAGLGDGRGSGSDAWKAYMRRATNTINYSDE